MKLKYYMRGMGVGLLVATIVLFVSYSLRYNDEGIIREAKKLGMEMPMKNNGTTIPLDITKNTESTAGGDDTKDGTSAEQDESSKNESSKNESSKNETSTERTSKDEISKLETSKLESVTTAEITTAEITTAEITTREIITQEITTQGIMAAEMITFTISKGMNSKQVAQALAEAGLVDDANAFDDYICREGYGSRLKVGIYTVKKGLGRDELIRMITGR